MAKITLGLDEWIALSARHGARSVGHDGGAGAAAGHAHVGRAVKAALLLLEALQGGGPGSTGGPSNGAPAVAMDAEDIAVENFMVDVEVEGATQDVVAGHQEGRDGNDRGELLCTQGKLTAVRRVAPLAHKSIDGDRIIAHAIFRKIGWLLLRLFCGASPPNELVRMDDGKNPSQDQPRDQSGSQKRLHKTDIESSHENMFPADMNVPRPVCRLVLDLLRSDDGMEHPFGSISDIALELKLITKEPNGHTTTPQPNFGKRIYGRSRELRTLVEAAATITIGGQNKLVLVAGDAGSGKSCLVESVGDTLSNERGYLRIYAKFDRLPRQRALSTIGEAFDRFFASVAAQRQNEGANAEDAASLMEAELSVSEIAALSNLMPSLRRLFPEMLRRVVSDPDLLALAGETRSVGNDVGRGSIVEDEEDDEAEDAASNAQASRNRLHYLFRRLVHAISSPNHPLLICLDDLHWIDGSSLDLISSLLLDLDHLDEPGEHSQCFLIVGTYRDCNVDETHILRPFLSRVEQSDTVRVSNIALGAISTEHANFMMSTALCLPPRMTRGLTSVVISKTLGNPFHIKAFVASCVDTKVIDFSLLEREWGWDLEEVRAMAIDESVAELLERRLLQLPSEVQAALETASCFGSSIDDENILRLISSPKGEWKHLIAGLDAAVEENILQKTGHSYQFVHDLLQQASYEQMNDEERGELHFKIGLQLMSSEDPGFGPTSFTAISQINQASCYGAGEMFNGRGVVFATMNLTASRKSVEVSDFLSAVNFAEYGISFLPDGAWESHYELTLHLHEDAAHCCFALSLMGKVKRYLENVLDHAACLEDKLKGYYLLVRALAATACFEEAEKRTLVVLNQLGESFPDPGDITIPVIMKEVSSASALVKELAKKDVLAERHMTNRSRSSMWKVKFLAAYCIYLLHGRPSLAPLIASRLVKVSASSGYINDSAFGFLLIGHAMISMMHDLDNGVATGKLALKLLEDLDAKDPRVMVWFCAMFAHWIEPAQATISTIGETLKLCLAAGDNETASMSLFGHCRMRFMAGDNLSACEKYCAIVASQQAQIGQMNLQVAATMLRSVALKLIGSDSGLDETHQELGEEYFRKYGKVVVREIALNKTAVAFWFGRYDEAVEWAAKHDSRRLLGLFDVMHIFYEGLASMKAWRARSSGDEARLEIGRKATASFRAWSKQSTWNFEHRASLLEAELSFSQKEVEKAEERYQAAIESARRHRFVHEEGLANQLLATFYTNNGNAEKAKYHIAQARDCYSKWGAFALVRRLDETSSSGNTDADH